MATPAQLAVDLHHLWFTAKSLREMGTAHTGAAGIVDGCNPSSALSRPASIGLGSNGFYDDWSALKEQVIGVLNTNGSSLNDTGDALDVCVKTYTDTDTAVQTELDALKATIPYE
ncbi:hypothetical protein NSZ01_40180 [Nocardioides szechwanensis]|uniref:Excreted virulence factor EspC, type VII ESX diderm n=1 Tax=Nocardioides szechwanensis TaxID=1005944 RepID=A0A1H0LLX7_9ACTN|nr:hypothetical protein [Nocardioides szechwanensis]GEP36250.1 hypothetical protein NSZ01_40180 [Nocardioides szechwanensis]SDO68981.1 hypothetical protein SAMN05192576_0278 [Nocardioides szechwanensis]